MTPRSKSRNGRRQRLDLVNVDLTKFRWHLQRSARSKSAFADACGIGRTSLHRIERGQAVQRSTVQLIASALSVPVEALLESTQVSISPGETVSPWKHPEWQIIPETQSAFRVMSNGLVMRVAKVRHRLLETEFGRAKLYDIAGMPAAARSECRSALLRHAVVCRRLAKCRFIARNLTMTALENESFWIAVDAWCDSTTLADEIGRGPLPLSRISEVMTQVGSGMSALHAERILLRELHSESVLIRQDDGSCLLTDLELAKLLETEATVSSNWQVNPYRAPEVASGVAKPQSDVHSFARLFVHLLLGTLPDFPGDEQALREKLLPGHLCDLLTRSLSPNWNKRPGSFDEILSSLTELEASHG